MLICMQSTSVRVDVVTHRSLKTIAETLDVSVGEAVRLAVRGLRQELMGAELTEPLSAEETAWLDAELG